MDESIPSHENAIYDYLDIIFGCFKSELGEHSTYKHVKDINIISISTDKAIAISTKILDKNLWQILFNRLNINSLMSAKAKSDFQKQVNDNPLLFSRINVESTLLDILSRKDEMLISGLVDSIQSASGVFSCNDNYKFNKKTIFKDAVKLSYDNFKLLDGPFKDTITFLSKVVLGQNTTTSIRGSVEDTYLWSMITDYFNNRDGSPLDRDTLEFDGGSIVFFNKGTAHLTLNNSTLNFLNNKLSGTNGLFNK